MKTNLHLLIFSYMISLILSLNTMANPRETEVISVIQRHQNNAIDDKGLYLSTRPLQFTAPQRSLEEMQRDLSTTTGIFSKSSALNKDIKLENRVFLVE